jgi:hypothetical protein
MKTFIVYDLDSKMPVAVGEQISAEAARCCASAATGIFHSNLLAEEIDLEKTTRLVASGPTRPLTSCTPITTSRIKRTAGPPIRGLIFPRLNWPMMMLATSFQPLA